MRLQEIEISMEAAESQARSIERDSKNDSVHVLDDKQSDSGKGKEEIAIIVG